MGTGWAGGGGGGGGTIEPTEAATSTRRGEVLERRADASTSLTPSNPPSFSWPDKNTPISRMAKRTAQNAACVANLVPAMVKFNLQY